MGALYTLYQDPLSAPLPRGWLKWLSIKPGTGITERESYDCLE